MLALSVLDCTVPVNLTPSPYYTGAGHSGGVPALRRIVVRGTSGKGMWIIGLCAVVAPVDLVLPGINTRSCMYKYSSATYLYRLLCYSTSYTPYSDGVYLYHTLFVSTSTCTGQTTSTRTSTRTIIHLDTWRAPHHCTRSDIQVQ